MLDELRQYYEANEIAAKKFNCRHYSECSKDCAKFTKAKEAFVSTGYEKHELPRVLFLSLDSGEGDQNDNHRTLLYVREQEEEKFTISGLDGEQHKHWYRTHELAHWFLRKYRWSLRIDQVHHYFAHTTSAKCCMNLEHKVQADKRLYVNCREYIPGEVSILNPDILVTQGDEAEIAILGKYKEADLALFVATSQVLPEVRVITINDAPVLWFSTYHPSNYGKFNAQRSNKFSTYTKLALDFIKKTKRWRGTIT